jgi:hypothetical protein
MKNIDWSKYRFRASQAHFLMVGTIGLTEVQENTLKTLLQRKIGYENGSTDENGKVYKPLTEPMEADLKKYQLIKSENALPKTMESKLREIYRAEKYGRNFIFTNKFIVKGINEEDEAITLYQQYRTLKGINSYFIKNKIRVENEWFSGEVDLTDTNDVYTCSEIFDTKCSWSLDTFPFKEDPLTEIYEVQNQVYMDLLNVKKATTVYCLVNCSEQQLFNEKQKHFYALGMPSDAEHKNYDEYVEKCKEIEKMLIYDYDRFIDMYNPILEISREEWFENGYDIPISERVIEKQSIFDQCKIDDLKNRITIARNYLCKLQESDK